ncbi:glycosyltransferase family 4 protein [Leptolyngbya sp. BC1307]|uniref:glycosyltransferase family 4 protein n=1 Tax=Leptolyngbya sp. BC1307 TaxID=2029589 RepID=UPI000EFBAC06|nr:glycosyltransferase family 4 protein [Leptolyngbya sp. BC1307]
MVKSTETARAGVYLPAYPPAKPYQILLVGPSLAQKGGMASVQKLIVGSQLASIDIQHVSTHDEGSVMHRLRVFAASVGLLTKRLIGGADLVHLHVAEKGSVLRKILLLLLAKAFRKPVIMHTHGCEFHTFHDGLPGWLRYWVDVALRQADCFIVLSESWKDYYLTHCDLNPDRVIVLPNPVEIPASIPDRSASSVTRFVFLGRIGQRKGAFDLLQAFANLPADCLPQAQLTLAGDGELEKAGELIKQLNVEGYVELPGWVDLEQRNQLLWDADVFILPSYNEGLPMAMLEAMAWGLPVISTPVGGIPEVIVSGENGYLADPGDIKALSAAMQSLVEDDALRLAMGHSARKRIEPLDLTLYCERLTKIYRSVLEKSHS